MPVTPTTPRPTVYTDWRALRDAEAVACEALRDLSAGVRVGVFVDIVARNQATEPTDRILACPALSISNLTNPAPTPTQVVLPATSIPTMDTTKALRTANTTSFTSSTTYTTCTPHTPHDPHGPHTPHTPSPSPSQSPYKLDRNQPYLSSSPPCPPTTTTTTATSPPSPLPSSIPITPPPHRASPTPPNLPELTGATMEIDTPTTPPVMIIISPELLEVPQAKQQSLSNTINASLSNTIDMKPLPRPASSSSSPSSSPSSPSSSPFSSFSSFSSSSPSFSSPSFPSPSSIIAAHTITAATAAPRRASSRVRMKPRRDGSGSRKSSSFRGRPEAMLRHRVGGKKRKSRGEGKKGEEEEGEDVEMGEEGGENEEEGEGVKEEEGMIYDTIVVRSEGA